VSQLDPLRFIFFGEDVFSLVVLESLVNSNLNLKPLFVVMLHPVSTSGQRLVKYCDDQGIPVLQTKSVRSDEFLTHFDGLRFELIISAHFQRILPGKLFSKARLGGVNLHPSLLPKYRGMSPQHWPIVLGDAETGVTVHLIDEGVDTGNILRQESIVLSRDIYIHELQKKLLSVYKTIMVDAVSQLILGDKGCAQPSEGAAYFDKIKEEDMIINLDAGVDRVYGIIRAFSFPYQGARFENLRIMKAVPVSNDILIEIKESSATLGIWRKGKSVYLILVNGVLELTRWNQV
jgi:methionyl-tRNA formyltransferase